MTVFVASMAVVVLFMGCKKEKEISEKAYPIETPVCVSELPVYYNGIQVESAEYVYNNLSKSGDMQLVSVKDTNSIHFFDEDSLFHRFCTIQQLEALYVANRKLDLIHAKAVELNILDTDAIPQNMEGYWQSLWGTSYSMDTCNNNRTCFAIDAYDADYVHGYGSNWVYFATCRPLLFSMDRIISSFRIYYNVGWVVWCQERWFGTPRTFYRGFHPLDYKDYSLANSPDNNKYRSYFNILP